MPRLPAEVVLGRPDLSRSLVNALFLMIYYIAVNDQDPPLFVIVLVCLRNLKLFAQESGLYAKNEVVAMALDSILVFLILHLIANLAALGDDLLLMVIVMVAVNFLLL